MKKGLADLSLVKETAMKYSQLYLHCISAGICVSSLKKQYSELVSLISQVNIDDFIGVIGDVDQYFSKKSITSCILSQTDEVGIGLILIPKDMFIDLHDHPGMTVSSKILQGKVVRYSMDKLHPVMPKKISIESFPLRSPRSFHAMINNKKSFKEGEMFNLMPEKGNIHCFLATKNAAIFDVLTPYYSGERLCSFYEIQNSHDDIDSCVHCIATLHSREKEGIRDTEIVEIMINEDLPSAEFNELEFNQKIEISSHKDNISVDSDWAPKKKRKMSAD